MISIIFLSFFIVNSVLSTEDVKDGSLYQLTSSLDNHVLTITSSDMEVGSNVTLQQWMDQSNQKFLAVTFKRGGDNEQFLLVPRRQKFDWENFVAQGNNSLKDRLKDFPDTTLVLGADKKGRDKIVTQQLKNDKPTQLWVFTKIASSGKYLIKNVEFDLCLKNPGVAKKHGVLSKLKGAIHHKKPKLVLIHMEGCNRDEIGQQWMIEVHN